MTSNKKQLYRTIVKILTLIGVCLLSFFLIRSVVLPTTTPLVQYPTVVTVDLLSIAEGKIKIVRWNNSNIAVLHRPKEMQAMLQDSLENKQYFVFVNSGGDVNCPLIVESKTKTMLKDICSAYLYDASGKAIKQDARVQNLIIPPHHFTKGNKLIIGES